MIERSFKTTVNFLKQKPVLLCTLTTIVVLTVDYLTGRIIRFPIAYVLPVGIAAWMNKKHAAYILAFTLPTARIVFHFLWHETESMPIAILNSIILILTLFLYAYLVEMVARQKRLLSKRLKVMEGILPVCASCKRIRTQTGEYEQMEKYISEHAEVSFSHGLCPECTQKLYPEYYRKG